MLQRGEVTPDMIPNDVPVPVDRQALESTTKELYQPGYRGHSFAPTVGVRGFRKWK